MPDLTSRLALKKPRGGSSGSAPAEQVDIDVINGNMDSLDGAVGAGRFASTSRPATPFDGQFVRETDTGDLIAYDQITSQWQAISGGLPRALGSVSQSIGTISNTGAINDVATVTFNATKPQNIVITIYTLASATANAAGNLYLKLNNTDVLIPATGRIAGLNANGRVAVSLVAYARCVVGTNTAKFQATADTGGVNISFNDIRFGVSTY